MKVIFLAKSNFASVYLTTLVGAGHAWVTKLSFTEICSFV